MKKWGYRERKNSQMTLEASSRKLIGNSEMRRAKRLRRDAALSSRMHIGAVKQRCAYGRTTGTSSACGRSPWGGADERERAKETTG